MKKICTKCKVEKDFSFFSTDKSKTDGFYSSCKICNKNAHSKYYSKNKQQIIQKQIERHKKIYELEKENICLKQRQRYWENPEKYRKRTLDYVKQNPEGNAKRTADYRSRQIMATPKWYDSEKVAEIYALAQEFRNHGLKVDVDHIIPLKNRFVCGLHVQENLRVCLSDVNKKKSNKYEEKI
jgi:hypothetical protein